MNAETQALLFNAVPLLVLAALYLAMGASLLPVLWRERRGTREIGYATALVFPAVGVAAALLGVQTLVTREPLAGHPFAVRRDPDRRPAAGRGRPQLGRADLLVTGVRRAHEAEQRPRCATATGWDRPPLAPAARCRRPTGDRPPGPRRAHGALRAGRGEPRVGRERGTHGAHPCGARTGPRQRVHDRAGGLARARAFGVGTVVRDGGGFAVFDAEASPIVNKRLNEIARVKSCAFVPMRVGEEVVGVVFAGVRHSRLFDQAELAFMQTLAAEAGLALQRSRSAAALADALERERLIARISLAVRSRRDLDELLRVAVEETAKAEDVDQAATSGSASRASARSCSRSGIPRRCSRSSTPAACPS